MPYGYHVFLIWWNNRHSISVTIFTKTHNSGRIKIETSDKPNQREFLQNKWPVLFMSAKENQETVTEEIKETWQLIAMW